MIILTLFNIFLALWIIVLMIIIIRHNQDLETKDILQDYKAKVFDNLPREIQDKAYLDYIINKKI